VTFLAVIAILGGLIPEFSWTTEVVSFRSSAYTQDFTADQIKRYAKAVLLIETERKQAYQAISQILGKSPPVITCNHLESFNNLPANAQRIAVDYCNNSKKIVQDSGLNATEFNAITNRVRSDDNLRRRVQNEMIRLQRENK
jgi:signal recognition particle receptor subunit beta